MEWLLEWDRELLLALNSLHAPWADVFMMTSSRTLVWIPLFVLLLWAIWRNYGWGLWLPLLFLALTITLSDQIASGFLKPTVQRLRPCQNADIGSMVHIVDGYCSRSFSFTSSHASNSVALAVFWGGICRTFRPRWLWIVVWLWAFLHSYSRIYLGVHYPLDILGGAIVGLASAAACLYLFRKVFRLKALQGLLPVVLLLFCFSSLQGQTPAADTTKGPPATEQKATPADSTSAKPERKPEKASGSPVVFEGDTLFVMYADLPPFSARDRAVRVVSQLTNLKGKVVEEQMIDSLKAVHVTNGTEIRFGKRVLCLVLPLDWQSEGLTEFEATNKRLQAFRKALKPAGLNFWDRELWIEVSLSLFATLILIIVLWLLRRGFRKLQVWIAIHYIARLPHPQFQNLQLLDKSIWERIFGLVMQGLRIFTFLLALYIYLPIVFGLFPATRGLAYTLIGYILEPLKFIGKGFLSFLPNLFFIVVAIFVTKYLLRLLYVFFSAIREEKISLPGFYPDWSKPTYNLIRILVVAFALVIIFPYLPGSDSPAFQGVSIFLGILFSLGSSSVISNVVAGVVLTYMRPFQIGDRVQIENVVGDVIEKTLFVTRIRTPKQVEISITNAQIIGHHIINYSTEARKKGVILHTTITIGYDVPWKNVESYLLDAASRTENLLSDPPPFVLQNELQDFYVAYEINVYTLKPELMPRLYSDLHRNIQDCFNEAGVEILSPHYRAMRDGSMITIPPDYLPEDPYNPAFRVHHVSPVSAGKLETTDSERS